MKWKLSVEFSAPEEHAHILRRMMVSDFSGLLATNGISEMGEVILESAAAIRSSAGANTAQQAQPAICPHYALVYLSHPEGGTDVDMCTCKGVPGKRQA